MSFKLNDFQPKWIQEEIDDSCIAYMEGFGFHLCDKRDTNSRPGYNAVTTSQMRNIFSEVKRIELKVSDTNGWQREKTAILLLRPKIAYSTARATSSKRDSRMKDLREILEKAIQAVKNAEDFKRFAAFLEGVIAYHKVYGGN
jgi:CRISPR-associated protein Csm2